MRPSTYATPWPISRCDDMRYRCHSSHPAFFIPTIVDCPVPASTSDHKGPADMEMMHSQTNRRMGMGAQVCNPTFYVERDCLHWTKQGNQQIRPQLWDRGHAHHHQCIQRCRQQCQPPPPPPHHRWRWLPGDLIYEWRLANASTPLPGTSPEPFPAPLITSWQQADQIPLSWLQHDRLHLWCRGSVGGNSTAGFWFPMISLHQLVCGICQILTLDIYTSTVGLEKRYNLKYVQDVFHWRRLTWLEKKKSQCSAIVS